MGAPAEVEIVKHEMYLYPNPVAEQLQVFIPGWSGQDIQIRILDLYGRTVHIVPCTLDTIDPVCSVSLQDFPTGSYLIQGDEHTHAGIIYRNNTKTLNFMRYLLTALSLAVTGSQAQVILGDAINDGILPADDEPICDIPIYPEMLAYTCHV